MLRIGVVGAGHISDYHLMALTSLPDVHVRIVTAKHSAKALAMARRHGVPCASANWRDLIGMVDAAVVASPDNTHVEIASTLADHGVHVLVQKPLAPSAEEARVLLRSACAARVRASFMHRYLPAVVRLGELINAGDIGRLLSARIRNATGGPDWGGWFYTAEGPIAGVIGQLGVHGIDLVEHLLGTVETVQAVTATRVPIRRLRDGSTVTSHVPDHAFVHYRLSGGLLVSHEQCWAESAGTRRFRMEIHGSAASVHLDDPEGPLTMYRSDRQPLRIPVTSEAVLGVRQHSEWLRQVRTGENDGSARAALRGLEVAEATARAAATGRTIEITTES